LRFSKPFHAEFSIEETIILRPASGNLCDCKKEKKRKEG